MPVYPSMNPQLPLASYDSHHVVSVIFIFTLVPSQEWLIN